MMATLFLPPVRRAASRRSDADTPAAKASSSRSTPSSSFFSASRLFTLAPMNSLSSIPSSRIAFRRPFRRETSLPGRYFRWLLAYFFNFTSRMLASTSVASFFVTARMTRYSIPVASAFRSQPSTRSAAALSIRSMVALAPDKPSRSISMDWAGA